MAEQDVIGSWTEVKLEILGEYAAPYSKILAANNFHHLYIDAFAAGGSHISRATGEIVAGSPLRALSTRPPFREYHFIDKDPARVDQLRQYTADRSDVFVHEGDCNAERLAHRLQAMGQKNYRNGFNVTLQADMLDHPLRWKKPRRIFVNSMSDLFHEQVPAQYIQSVFDVMRRAPRHQYQVLTKRSERLMQMNSQLDWRRQMWMGVSIENEDYLYRADHLRLTGAHIKFLSVEPLLGPLRKLNLRGIDWVIVGGESGPGARNMDPDWVREIRDRCIRAHVAFFFKQWGGVLKARTGRVLDGRTWNDMPGVRSDAVNGEDS